MRYFLEISYNGKNYHGWQIQPNAITAQEVLQQTISTVLKRKISVTAAGRTDTGVHAKQLFVHIDFLSSEEKIIENTHFLYRINSFLPKDITVKNSTKVLSNAHTRFDAINRSYEYYISLEKNPFTTETTWQMQKPLDIKKMNEAAAILLKYTNFKCFSKSKTAVKTYNCTIEKAFWKQQEDTLIFYITANRFLRNMVRAIVGTLVAIGQGKKQVEAMHAIIKSEDRSKAGVSVPAHGLFLTNIQYPKTIYLNE